MADVSRVEFTSCTAGIIESSEVMDAHKKSEFQFGVTRVRGVFASPDNPIRDGIFVEHVGRDRVRLTDGKGQFWMFDRDAVVIHRATETEAELQARCEELHDKIRRQRYPEQYAKSDPIEDDSEWANSQMTVGEEQDFGA